MDSIIDCIIANLPVENRYIKKRALLPSVFFSLRDY
jgi:hypothetical protein